ncbi:hypothetical protein [Priestia sp. J2]|uniref:hypothetical protein n=1 Tax=Priestia sp. J2 TaxID=2886505 RepID=UPI001E320E19|nr:hypothetical protein [Priestia sp. J2]
MMPHPQTEAEKLDDFYNYMLINQGLKPHEIDQMDIHHLFKLVRKQIKQNKENDSKGSKKQEEGKPRQGFLDEIPGW